LAEGLPLPVSELRLVEVPLTVNVSLDGAGMVDAQVWSVVCFGAEELGAPRVAWRTSHLRLVWERSAWKLTAFETIEGPTPVAGDDLPAEWAEFVTVTDWRQSVAGVV
jgi:hypothetical protein